MSDVPANPKLTEQQREEQRLARLPKLETQKRTHEHMPMRRLSLNWQPDHEALKHALGLKNVSTADDNKP